MKLNRKNLRKLILQEMSHRSRGMLGRDPNVRYGREEAGEYIMTPERQEAERIRKLKADLNAKGLAQIQDAMSELNLDAKWLPLFKQKMNQYGWITDYSFDDFTVTFQGKPNQFAPGGYQEYVWELRRESPPRPDYEGRN